jgi:hypothetical protein
MPFYKWNINVFGKIRATDKGEKRRPIGEMGRMNLLFGLRDLSDHTHIDLALYILG